MTRLFAFCGAVAALSTPDDAAATKPGASGRNAAVALAQSATAGADGGPLGHIELAMSCARGRNVPIHADLGASGSAVPRWKPRSVDAGSGVRDSRPSESGILEAGIRDSKSLTTRSLEPGNAIGACTRTRNAECVATEMRKLGEHGHVGPGPWESDHEHVES